MTYEIGYKKPPVKTQFKKGHSGNLKGRPKGSKTAIELFEKVLGRNLIVNDNGKKVKLTSLEVIYRHLISDAAKGDKKAIKIVFDLLNQLGGFEYPEVPAPSSILMHQQVEEAVKRAGAIFDRYLVPSSGPGAKLPDCEGFD